MLVVVLHHNLETGIQVLKDLIRGKYVSHLQKNLLISVRHETFVFEKLVDFKYNAV